MAFLKIIRRNKNQNKDSNSDKKIEVIIVVPSLFFVGFSISGFFFEELDNGNIYG